MTDPKQEPITYFPKSNYRTAQEWHRYYVYNDPDFVKEARIFLFEFEEKYSQKDYDKARRKYEKTGRKVAVLDKEDQQRVLNLASKFCISPLDIQSFVEGWWLDLPQEVVFDEISIDRKSGQMTIRFPYTIARADYENGWRHIEEVREHEMGYKTPKTKRKPPENPDLIYAIFKQRQTNTPFSEIFIMYSTHKLKGYENKSNAQFNSEDSLERYYNRYKPQPAT